MDAKLTVGICTYNRAARLPALVRALRDQECPIPFEILLVNNNSQDDTLAVLASLAAQPGARLRYVTEAEQGIVPARNRVLAEARDSDYLVFLDDDELPGPGLLAAAVQEFQTYPSADCLGGRVEVDFSGAGGRPAWLGDELLGFLGGVDYGDQGFWIKDDRTPVWTSNVAYRMALFRNDPSLRFDPRFNRKGKGVVGGEDVHMFLTLLQRGTGIRYCPAMVTRHGVEAWRLYRWYFLRLHAANGYRAGRFEQPPIPGSF